MGKFRLAAATAAAGLLAGATAAGAMTLSKDTAGNVSGMIQKVHSVYEARDKLERHGYYNVQTERATIPYSFIACKRGVRYHIHINYYGDLEQVDPVGACRSYGDGNGRDSYGYGRGYGRGGDYEDRPNFAQRFRPQRYRRYDY